MVQSSEEVILHSNFFKQVLPTWSSSFRTLF